MPRVAIIGAGQSGMQLALGLRGARHEVTVVSNRTAQEIHDGPVMSSQCMFETALQAERDLDLDWWEQDCPAVEGIGLAVPGPGNSKAIDWVARLDGRAKSVDQRVKVSAWMTEFAKRGGELMIREAGIDELESCAESTLSSSPAAKGDPLSSSVTN
jgi:hypothetical protein